MKFWSSKNKQVYVVTRKTRKPELVHSSKPWAPELEKLSNFYSAGRWDSFYSITSTWTAPSVIIHHLSFLALTSQNHSFALDSYLFFFFFKTLLIWLLGHLPLCSQVASELSLAVGSLQRCLSWGCKIFPSLQGPIFFLPIPRRKEFPVMQALFHLPPCTLSFPWTPPYLCISLSVRNVLDLTR